MTDFTNTDYEIIEENKKGILIKKKPFGIQKQKLELMKFS